VGWYLSNNGLISIQYYGHCIQIFDVLLEWIDDEYPLPWKARCANCCAEFVEGLAVNPAYGIVFGKILTYVIGIFRQLIDLFNESENTSKNVK
jgi:hypothetical protein